MWLNENTIYSDFIFLLVQRPILLIFLLGEAIGIESDFSHNPIDQASCDTQPLSRRISRSKDYRFGGRSTRSMT